MTTPHEPRPCIQGATIDLDLKLASLPRYILWGLERKLKRIDPCLRYGEVLVPISKRSKMIFRYKLATKSLNGPIIKTDDGTPVLIIYSIDRAIFGIPIPRVIRILNPRSAIAIIIYYISKYLE